MRRLINGLLPLSMVYSEDVCRILRKAHYAHTTRPQLAVYLTWPDIMIVDARARMPLPVNDYRFAVVVRQVRDRVQVVCAAEAFFTEPFGGQVAVKAPFEQSLIGQEVATYGLIHERDFQRLWSQFVDRPGHAILRAPALYSACHDEIAHCPYSYESEQLES